MNSGVLRNRGLFALFVMLALTLWQWHELDHCVDAAGHEAHCPYCMLGVTPDQPPDTDLTTAVTPPGDPVGIPCPADLEPHHVSIERVTAARAPPYGIFSTI